MNRSLFFRVSFITIFFIFFILSFSFFSVRIFLTTSDFYLLLNDDFSISDDMVNFFSYGQLDSNRYISMEIEHMNDVLTLLDFWFMMFIVLLILYFVFYRYFDRSELLFGFKLSLLFYVILFGLMFIFYAKAFVLFHEIFFYQGGWLFSYETLILKNMTDSFFFLGALFFVFWDILFCFLFNKFFLTTYL